MARPFWKLDPRPKPWTVRCRRGASDAVLDEKCGIPQCQKLVRWTDLICPIGIAFPRRDAHPSCSRNRSPRKQRAPRENWARLDTSVGVSGPHDVAVRVGVTRPVLFAPD